MKKIFALAAVLIMVSGCCSVNSSNSSSEDMLHEENEDCSSASAQEYTAPQCLADAMRTNSDVIAWIEIPDTMLSYPVMYREGEEEYYLRKDIEGKYSAAGLPFMQQGCSPDIGNVFIYGHYFKSGEMFGCLHDYYIYTTYYIQHPQVIIHTAEEKQIWDIFAVCRMQVQENGFVYNDSGYIDFETEGEFSMYMSYVYRNNMIDTGKAAEYGDRILMLSTCRSYREGDTERVVLYARKAMQVLQ